MATIESTLFGSLAIAQRYVGREQLEEALREQAALTRQGGHAPRLGEILVTKGYLTREQIKSLLTGQGGKGQGLFGEVAVNWSFCPAEEVDKGLAEQIEYRLARRRPRRLGEILLARGTLTPVQVHSILKAQGKQIIQCPGCQTRYNALHVRPGSQVSCPRCNTDFVPSLSATASSAEGEPVTEVRSDATAFLPAVQTEEEKRLVSEPTVPLPALSVAHYQVQARLGNDACGPVYKALNTATQAAVTIRLVAGEVARSPEDLDAWKQAAIAAIALDHPNLQRVLAVHPEDSRLLLVTEFHEGQSLRRRLEGAGKLGLSEALAILIQCAEALVYGLSKKLVHGDLRPCRVIVGSDQRVHVSGLGLPKSLLPNLKLLTARSAAVPFYTAPEVLRDPDDVTERSDVYSLCALGYHMVTGRAPQILSLSHRGHLRAAPPTIVSPQAISPLVRADVSRLLLKGLAKHPANRYRSIQELLADLRACQGALKEGLPDVPAVAPDFRNGGAHSRVGYGAYAGRALGPHPHRHRTFWRGLGGARLTLSETVPPLPARRAPETSVPAPQVFTPIQRESRKVVQAAAVLLVAGFLIAAAAWTFHRPPGPLQPEGNGLSAKDREALAEAERRGLASESGLERLVREDLAEHVTAYRLAHPGDHAEIVRRADLFLNLYAAKFGYTDAVHTAQTWRREHAQAGVAQTRAVLHEKIQRLLQQDCFQDALDEISAWRARWGEDAAGLHAEVLKGRVRTDERAHADAWLTQGRAKREQGDWAGARECFAKLAAHFAPEFVDAACREEALTAEAEQRARADRDEAAARRESVRIAAQRDAAAEALLGKLVRDLRVPIVKLDFPAAWRTVSEAEPALASTSAALGYQNVRSSLERIEGLVDRAVQAARSGRLKDYNLRVKDGGGVVVDATRQGPIIESGSVRGTVPWSSLDRATLADLFRYGTDDNDAGELADLALLHLYFGDSDEAGKLLTQAEELGAMVDHERELAAALRKPAPPPAVAASHDAGAPAWSADPVAAQRALEALGWEISRGRWSVNPDESLVGTPEPGWNLVSLHRDLPKFTRLDVEVRGEGDEAGFSFGKGRRFMARPTYVWHKLTFQVLDGGRMELLLDGEKVTSLEVPQNVPSDTWPGSMYLRGVGSRIEFRNFAVDGKAVCLPPPSVAQQTSTAKAPQDQGKQ